MIGWTILGGYVVGVVLSWRPFAIMLLESLEDIGELNDNDRASAAVFGGFLALIWPAALTARTAWRLVKRNSRLETPKEKLAAQQREIAELRRQAREYGLPMPGDQGTSSTARCSSPDGGAP